MGLYIFLSHASAKRSEVVLKKSLQYSATVSILKNAALSVYTKTMWGKPS